jgi:seryl-tRNA synthetase
VAEDREELEQYREKVVAEVERRMLRVREIENDIERASFAAGAASRARASLSANTARNQVEAAHRARLKGALKSLRSELEEAQADLERAEARLEDVESRLEAVRGESLE